MKDRDQNSFDDEREDLESPLGIAREPIARSAEDHLDQGVDDEASRRRRRMRALGETEEHSTGLGDVNNDPDGAAGIDMGYGGEGTNIKPSR